MVTGKLIEQLSYQKSEGKYRYFKCNFNGKTNYAHNFDEKHVLLWFDKKEINDEIIRRKEIDIYGKLFFSFFIWRKLDTPNVNFYLSTKKRFLQKHTLSNTRQIKFINFKHRFAQFHRKITDYTDMLIMYIMPPHSHIQEFTKVTIFCYCYWFCTDTTMVGKKEKIKEKIINDKWDSESC